MAKQRFLPKKLGKIQIVFGMSMALDSPYSYRFFFLKYLLFWSDHSGRSAVSLNREIIIKESEVNTCYHSEEKNSYVSVALIGHLLPMLDFPCELFWPLWAGLTDLLFDVYNICSIYSTCYHHRFLIVHGFARKNESLRR